MSVKVLKTDFTKVALEATFPHIPPCEVYPYWAEPTLLRQWWVEDVTQLNVHEGGAYQFDWHQMGWTLRGNFAHVAKNGGFMFTWAWDHLPEMPQRLVSVRFLHDDHGGTRLEVLHGIYDESKRDQQDRKSHIEGWTHFLQKLTEVYQPVQPLPVASLQTAKTVQKSLPLSTH